MSNYHTVEKWIVEWLKGQLFKKFSKCFLHTFFLSSIHWTAVRTPQRQNNLLNRLMDRPIKCLTDQLPTNWQETDWHADQLCDGVILCTGWLIISLITSDWLTKYNGQVDGCTDWLLTDMFWQTNQCITFPNHINLHFTVSCQPWHWLIDWLKNGLTDGRMNWHVEFDCQRNRWTNWLTDWWIDLLTDWLTDRRSN